MSEELLSDDDKDRVRKLVDKAISYDRQPKDVRWTQSFLMLREVILRLRPRAPPGRACLRQVAKQ